MTTTNVLYISYDGMTDPLGQSQVIPYLKALTQKGFSFTILSFEKPEVFAEQSDAIQQDLQAADIKWYHLRYTKFPPILSTVYDLWLMRRKALQIAEQESIKLIHARSYLPAMVGRWVRKQTGIPLLFDMRGFWADERVDGGLWRLSNPLYRVVYRYVKMQEQLLLKVADHTISLTEAGRKIIQGRKDLKRQPIPITVIPTCVDTERFDPSQINESITSKTKEDLGIPENTFVLGYVGSIGTWYLLDEMLAFFKQLVDQRKAVFLFVSKDNPKEIYSRAEKVGIDCSTIIFRPAQYSEVPSMISVFDAGIFFIQPALSKAASAPTKMGELLAVGKPVICNDGVGDVGDLVHQYDCGIVVHRLDQLGYKKAIQQVDQLLQVDADRYRQAALSYFSLASGVSKYKAVYDDLTKKKGIIHYFLHHRPGRSPGQRFRCEQYVPYLEEAGFRIQWRNLLTEEEDKLFYSQDNWGQKAQLIFRKHIQRWHEVRQVKKGDIVFIYREAFMLWHTWYERMLKRRGARLVFDFDDAIWLRDVSEGNRKVAFLKRPSKTADICRLSDVVIVGNEYLKSYASQYARRVEVVPTTIDTAYHQSMSPTTPYQGVCIGWTGSDTTIRHFEEIVPVLEHIKELYGARVWFKLISNRAVCYPSLDLEATLWSKEEEVAQLADIDIGIMPLPDDAWSKGKCGFKLLQYMAMGKPVVASPVGVNTEIVQHNLNGYLASTEEEWIAALSGLIDDAHLREIMGARGRQKVVSEYSLANKWEQYVSLFRELAE